MHGTPSIRSAAGNEKRNLSAASQPYDIQSRLTGFVNQIYVRATPDPGSRGDRAVDRDIGTAAFAKSASRISQLGTVTGVMTHHVCELQR